MRYRHLAGIPFERRNTLAIVEMWSSSVRLLSAVFPSTRPSRRLRITSALLLCTVLTILLPWSRSAFAAPFEATDTGWEGASTFIQLLGASVGSSNVIATGTLSWSDLKPEDALVVLHPIQSLNPDELSAFLKAGGRVAILDDFGAADENLKRFQIERVLPPRRPTRTLRNNPALAIAEPVSDVTAGLVVGVHPVVANVSQLVTNHPAALTHPNLTPVLRIPARGEPDAIIAVAGKVGLGRLFVVSDPSVIINQMLRYPGNRAFVSGLAQYLVEDDKDVVRRQGRIIVVANQFRETGAFGGQSSFARSLGATFRDIGRQLDDLHRKGVPSQLAIAIGALSALAALLWLALAAARGYRRAPPRFARAVPLVAQGGVAGRAAVLAAPSTHRALALLELKSALEEVTAARLELDLPLSAPTLIEALRRSEALDDSRLQSLKKLLFTMGMVETSVAAGKPIRVRERELKAAAAQVRDVIESIDNRGGGRPAEQGS